ncbi:hypothetical protein QQZ08_004004 [Neonectria magnoliae]|uniref:BZIP domain-containing protein n=1 Tax=Neonectria magnoliae TaxID=2732573 RepID=A0ABR1I930_9HYPO
MPAERVTGEAQPTNDAKLPRKRVMTAARKEQNRVAQMAYRKLQREHRQMRTQTQQRDRRKLPVLQPHTDPESNACPPLSSVHSIQGEDELQIYPMVAGHVNLPPVQPPETDNHCQELTILSKPLVPVLPEPLNLDWDPTGLSFVTDPALAESGLSSSTRTDDDILSTDDAASNTESSLLPSAHSLDLSRLPCIKRNSIRLVPTNVACAVLENALSLGFDLTKIVACTGEYISPFYQPNASPQNDPEALIAYSAAIVNPSCSSRSIPAHLRPTLAQVLIPHDASLDLIPLPFLRDRAIMLSAVMPDTFNLWELKADIYHRGGLVIWQCNRTGLSSKAESPFYQPWDYRSWQGAQWFFQKWCMVVGGKESALWKQSAWWHALRGVEGS